MNVLPLVPHIGGLKSAAHVSASASDRLLGCPLRFAFDHDPALRRQPYVASALVGTAAHAVLAALISSRGSGAEREGNARTRDVARRAFDDALAAECRRRDAVIAERGELPGDSTDPPAGLPFYAMTRARLARFAEQRFGQLWLWPVPRLDMRASHQPGEDRRRSRDVEPEFPLQSQDGLIRGSADVVDQSSSDVIIEEFKTGEATPERLKSWKHQLLIYAQLYLEQYGRLPKLLRVHSLVGGVHDFPCVEQEAATAAQVTRAALHDLNQRIANGARPEDLARPSESACKRCPHRAWCEPYWSAAAPGSNGADADGTIVSADGWEADLLRTSGNVTRTTFKALRIAPLAGMQIRICGARISTDGTLVCDRTTSVWRVGP